MIIPLKTSRENSLLDTSLEARNKIHKLQGLANKYTYKIELVLKPFRHCFELFKRIWIKN